MCQVFTENGIATELQTTIGKADFTALDIEDYCEDLQVTVRRTPAYNQTSTNQAINVSVWGHVAKALVVSSDGAYTIVNTNS